MEKTYQLGTTELKVSAIGLGTWQFSRSTGLAGKYWAAIPQETVVEIVRASLEGGINWFDTAEVYGNGASEESLADALAEIGTGREDYVIADKWFPAFRTAASIRKTFPARERALASIVVDPAARPNIDLHQIHQPFSLSSIDKQAAEMGHLVKDGLVRAVGVSNFNEPRMRRAHERLAAMGVPLASNQMRYSLIDREIERNGVLDAAKELGVTIIAYSPLSQGILTGRFHEGEDIKRSHGPRKWLGRFSTRGLAATRPLIDRLRAVAADHGCTPAQVALAWTFQIHGTSMVAIPGASSPGQAGSNAAALNVQLSPDELGDLDQAGRDTERILKKLR
ncbi:MAG: aldo/keto reductase [Spirochaetaceae bacterium]|nr:MAG: aldo/keto reductase [Spirochaetaceae bacterium]